MNLRSSCNFFLQIVQNDVDEDVILYMVVYSIFADGRNAVPTWDSSRFGQWRIHTWRDLWEEKRALYIGITKQNKTKQWAYNGFVLVKGFSCWVGRGEHNDGSYAQILNAL